MDWNQLAEQVLEGQPITRDQGLAVLRAPDTELLGVLQGAFRLRHHHWGYGVQVHVLQNAKQGLCQEDCSFCSQANGAQSGVLPYRMQSVEEMVAGAHRAKAAGAVRYCLVTATRGPSQRDLDTICTAVRRIKDELDIQICTSLGLMGDDAARQLAEAGVNRFNHNLETSRTHYPKVCTTHTYEDRLSTLRAAREAGMELCCGGIMGLGECHDDRLELAFALREVAADSIPVNFLDPRPGTPLSEVSQLTPQDCLRALCLFRYANPAAELRVAGGREVCLRSLQPLALYPANSIFSSGYLTTDGNEPDADRQMIADAGFEIAAEVTVE